jgi:hypothetical protein
MKCKRRKEEGKITTQTQGRERGREIKMTGQLLELFYGHIIYGLCGFQYM